VNSSYAPLAFLQGGGQTVVAFVYHQVFCDESGKHQVDPLIAFCAVTATADRLNAFDRDWRILLRSYEIDSLHMARASRLVEDVGYRLRKGQTVDERTDALIPFADLINKHLETGTMQAWDVRGFNQISIAVRKNLGGSNDPYFLAMMRALMEFIDRTGEDDRISLIFDDDPNTAWDSYTHFRSIEKAEPLVRKKFVAVSFANDKHFPALQAADMLAFLTRHEAAEQFNRIPNMWRRLFDRLTTEPKPPYGIMRWFKMFADEQILVDFANESIQSAEEANREREEERQRRRNRISEVQTDNGDNPPGRPRLEK
jgi:hypothetical protein